jgi:hypothetical protein
MSIHDKLILLGKQILADKGCNIIHEEYGVYINGKRYIVDLVGESPIGLLAVECDYGNKSSEEKLGDLKSLFKDVHVLDVETLVAYYEGLLNDYKTELDKLENALNEAQQKIEQLSERNKKLESIIAAFKKKNVSHTLSLRLMEGFVVTCPYEEHPIIFQFRENEKGTSHDKPEN